MSVDRSCDLLVDQVSRDGRQVVPDVHRSSDGTNHDAELEQSVSGPGEKHSVLLHFIKQRSL